MVVLVLGVHDYEDRVGDGGFGGGTPRGERKDLPDWAGIIGSVVVSMLKRVS